MRIGIDISQLAYQGTGVANYLQNLVEHLLQEDKENEYILFYSSLRKPFQSTTLRIKPPDGGSNRVTLREFKLPPSLLDILWNRLHIMPIEQFIGSVDIFITSDWVEPPVKKAKKATILYDLIVYKCPEETAQKIQKVQKRKLHWVKKESDAIICISEATKKDAMGLLGIPKEKLHVVYPGI